MELNIVVLFFLAFSLSKGCFIKKSVDSIIVKGEVTQYCEHNDIKYLAGQKFRTPDCYECYCEASFGLLCCGYGRNIPRYDFVGSEQCDIIEDGCEQYMVKKDDHRLDCFTGERLLNDINKDYDSSLQSLLDLFLRTQKL